MEIELNIDERKFISTLARAEWNLDRTADLMSLPREAMVPALEEISEDLLMLSMRRSMAIKQAELWCLTRTKVIESLDDATPTQQARMLHDNFRMLAPLLGIPLSDEPTEHDRASEPETPNERLAQSKLDKASRERADRIRFRREHSDMLRRYGLNLPPIE